MKGLSPSQLAWKRFYLNRPAVIALSLLGCIILGCLFGPFFLGFHYADQNIHLGTTKPSSLHWLGTDRLGRDMLARVLEGGRISFLVGSLATAVSVTIGVIYGTLSGYMGGQIDRLMMRVVEIIYSMPYIIFVIVLMVVFGRGLLPLLLAIGVVEWLTMARIIRGEVMSVKEQPFVTAAQALGEKRRTIIRKHILPNVMSTVIVCTTLTVPSVILVESTLSFLGIGVQAPMTSWGDLIREGVNTLETHPHLIITPSLFFSATLFCIHFAGNGLRDAFDPKYQGAHQ